MLINHTNHPHKDWSQEQLSQAKAQFGDVIDMPFPDINPNWGIEQVHKKAMHTISYLVNTYSQKFENKDIHVLIAGEQSYLIVFYLHARQHDIHSYVATSERNTILKEGGAKEVKFSFNHFRKIN